MKSLRNVLSVIIICMVAMLALPSVSLAATVGQQLTTQETGWQRIDDGNSNIKYVGAYWQNKADVSYWWSGTKHYIAVGTASTDIISSSVRFKFYGSQLRVIGGSGYSGFSSDLRLNIDGVDVYSGNVSLLSSIDQVLNLEKLNLSIGVHTVKIYSGDGKRFDLDAIDIDSSGYLVDINTPTNLTATPGNASVSLKWDAVDGATSYNIKRSTTAGGPYNTVIGTSTTNSYTDNTAENRTTYYYVVSAVVASVESPNSNVASATPFGDFTGNKAILEITMTNGNLKEYDLTATELDKFLTWYDNREAGIGKSYYVFTKTSNVKPFLSRKEYISFKKISSFEVKDYNE